MGEIVTGLLYLDPSPKDLHAHLQTIEAPLNGLGDADLVPGAATLEKFNAARR
jgi:2-oxoglutarate ferredoxin oxidoreductase subunit beta